MPLDELFHISLVRRIVYFLSLPELHSSSQVLAESRQIEVNGTVNEVVMKKLTGIRTGEDNRVP